MNWYENRARVLAIADATPDFDRVRAYPDQRTRRLDARTGQVSDYSRPARRQRDRLETNPPVFTAHLLDKLLQLEPGEGLFMQRRRYSPGFPIERRQPYADHSPRYQALFQVL